MSQSDPEGDVIDAVAIAAYRAVRDTASLVLLDRDVIRATGPEAEAYLQGQCSQDLSAVTVGRPLESLLLSPQGKVEVYLRITREGDDRFVLDTDRGFGPAMVARLERFRLRTKVEFEPLDWVCAAVRGPDTYASLVEPPELVLPVSWGALEGVDLLGPPPASGVSHWVDDTVTPCPAEVWEAIRIEAGIPVNGRELHEGTIAAEVGLVDRTVSFTKGCFTGQELVARLDARGSNVARHLRGVLVAADTAGATAGSPPSRDAVASMVGSAVVTADGQHEVGRLSSAAWSPGFRRVVALATLHRRVDPPEDVVVVWEPPGGNGRRLPAQAHPLPFPAS